MPDEPVPDDAAGLRAANARLRSVAEAKGIQQCAQHVIRRCRAVMKLGPGGVQDRAGDIIAIPGEAHRAVEDARARGSTALDLQVLDDLRERYDQAVKSGSVHNRLRDWDGGGNHPGYALATLARWCTVRSYLDSAAAHGTTALDAIRGAIEGKPWMPPLPALA